MMGAGAIAQPIFQPGSKMSAREKVRNTRSGEERSLPSPVKDNFGLREGSFRSRSGSERPTCCGERFAGGVDGDCSAEGVVGQRRKRHVWQGRVEGHVFIDLVADDDDVRPGSEDVLNSLQLCAREYFARRVVGRVQDEDARFLAEGGGQVGDVEDDVLRRRRRRAQAQGHVDGARAAGEDGVCVDVEGWLEEDDFCAGGSEGAEGEGEGVRCSDSY